MCAHSACLVFLFVCLCRGAAAVDSPSGALAAMDLLSDSGGSVIAMSPPRPVPVAAARPVSSPSSVVYDGFAAFEAAQEAARAAGRAALEQLSRPPAAMLANPLPAHVDSRPEYGRCVYSPCQLQRVAKTARQSTGANYGRVFLQCPESRKGNVHNESFVWRSDYYERMGKPLLPEDAAWKQMRAEAVAAACGPAVAQSQCRAEPVQAMAAAPGPASTWPFSQQPTELQSTPPQSQH